MIVQGSKISEVQPFNVPSKIRVSEMKSKSLDTGLKTFLAVVPLAHEERKDDFVEAAVDEADVFKGLAVTCDKLENSFEGLARQVG
ncbi:hypothetical protein AU210_014342 [Fusarium oxysporum f. sp. radicis-cucumerinum]|uniref:Uncharacterized protein n=1 Tax=Fusarium oxysporum f. sp. radicis-cucumerinum TaxID=327505 RepID=A0A2H3GEN7_FUSOX|nr:hypothetical protein AU210_014342 [Fusarium oxysporum f. sp. radicis-cucumerinum]